MTAAHRIVRHRDLAPSWMVLRAREPGYQRSLVTWMGGPAGYINTNPGVAIESQHCAVGLMDMGPGQRQPGVHTHSVVEVYVILDGMVESFDGVGNTHMAGPLDCLYIPKGVPHGVRTVGDRPVRLLWVNDAIERWGVSRYDEGPGPHPSADGRTVSAIRFTDLLPSWSALQAQQPGFRRWGVTWVGGADEAAGTNYNPAVAARNERVNISLVVMLPENGLPPDDRSRRSRLLIVARGRALLAGSDQVELGELDAVLCPAGEGSDLRALGDDPMHIVIIEMPK